VDQNIEAGKPIHQNPKQRVNQGFSRLIIFNLDRNGCRKYFKK
jgi:hypothetical protein